MSDSPAFQFYAADFLADENQRVMSPAEAGAYIRLICSCWLEGSIPTDLRRLAPLAGMSRSEMEGSWPALAACFEPHPDDPDRLVHPRVEKERRKQRTYSEQMAKAGRKGARRRWAKGSPPNGQAIARLPESGDRPPVENPAPTELVNGGKLRAQQKAREKRENRSLVPDSGTVREPAPDKDGDGHAIASPLPGHSQATLTPMAPDSSSSSTPEREGVIQPHATPPVTGGHEGKQTATPKRSLRDADRTVILEQLHLGAETVTIAGKPVSMELEMHIRDSLLAQYGEAGVHALIPKIRSVEEFAPDVPISLRLIEQRPEVAERALAEAALDGPSGPTPADLGATVRRMPGPQTDAQQEAKRKLDQARAAL